MPDLRAILAEDNLTLERLFFRLLEEEIHESRARSDERRRLAEEADER